MSEPPSEPAVRPDEWILFAAVIGGCFGSAITSSLFFVAAASGDAAGYANSFNTIGLLSLISFEMFTALLAVVALAAAGWRESDFPFRIDLAGTAAGIGLAVLMVFVSVLLAPATGEVDFPVVTAPRPSVSFLAFLLVCIVNPLYEEFFVLGFVVRFFERRGASNWQFQAAAASIAIRASYHLYQGAEQMPFHLAVGIAFAATFLLRRNLWPLVLAHVVLDFLGLYSFVR